MKKAKPIPGKLLAIEGLDDRELLRAGKLLLRKTSGAKAGGVSQWGASGLFFQLEHSKCPDVPSPKTLLMLYAADLAFRLRWEIGPLLEEGQDVVAAPYTETAIAFGRAAGLTPEWLERLFDFAPRPESAFRVSTPAGKAKGFPSHCSHLLTAASAFWGKQLAPKPLARHLTALKALPAAVRRRAR